MRASVQKNVTEDDDTRRWKAYSVLEYVFSQDDFGKSLICRVIHPAYTNDHEETAVKLDLLCKYHSNIGICLGSTIIRCALVRKLLCDLTG